MAKPGGGGTTDTTPPANPSSFTATGASATSIYLTWVNPTDADFAGLYLYRDGFNIATLPTTQTSYTDTGLTAGSAHNYVLYSYDTSNNQSSGATVTGVAKQPDTTPPAEVTNLKATNITSTSLMLTWTNPTDSDFASVKVYRNSVILSSGVFSGYNDSGLNPSTAYTYKITTVDTSNNESSGATLQVTTLSQGQQSSQAPSTPTNLFPFNGSAWTKLHFEADITDSDSTNLTFYVDYSTDSTLSTGITTLSSSVTLPSAGSTARGSITSANAVAENTVYYWRAYAKDDSGSQSAYSPIFSFTIKNATNDNMVADGTPFMQQGDANIHGIIPDLNSVTETAVNFTTMKNQGVKGCYLRVYGADHTTMDAMFTTWVGQAKTAGIPTGGYFYAMPKSPTLDLTDAHTQADLFISALQQGYGTGQYGDLIPVVDIEDNTGIAPTGQTTLDMTVSDLLTWTNEFRNYFEQQTGRTLGLYVNNYFVYDQRNNFNCDKVTGQPLAGTSGNIVQDMPLWIAGNDYYARYMGSVMPQCGGWEKWYVFQHTDKGSASTYGATTSAGNIDLSWCEPIEYMEPPKATTGITATNNGTDVTLTWTQTTEVDVHEWDIYVDGTKVGSSSTDGNYVIVNAQTGTHTVEVRPIDIFGDDPITTANTVSYTLGTSTPPNVTINSVTHYTISNETGFSSTDITITFDQDIQRWTVNVNGSDYSTGTVADSGVSTTVGIMATDNVGNIAINTVGSYLVITAGTQIIATIDWTELYQEGQNRVNIYGQNKGGTWTPYDNSTGGANGGGIAPAPL